MIAEEVSREQVIATALAMNDAGINAASAGNVSVRTADGMLITPSAMSYDQLCTTDIVAMSSDGAWESSVGTAPSSEWRFHLDIYRARPDVSAIVHAHPTHCTALAVHGRGIEPFHYMVAVAGGRDIRCAPYATFGTAALSTHVVAALDARRACLLAHHGLVATGATLASALTLAIEVESLAAQYLASLAIGEPPLLSDAQIDEVLAKMNVGPGYGSVTA